MFDSRLFDLITRARSGDSEALGELLERHRDALRTIADRELGDRLRLRVDASDVVQLTFLRAQQGFEGFRGESEPELKAWLRQILNQNVQDAVRQHVQAQQRAVSREVPMQAVGTSSLPFDPMQEGPTPSRLVSNREATAELISALAELPAEQCRALTLRHLESQSIAEIAAEMGKSEAAVAGLLRRGVVALRQKLHDRST